MAEKVKLVLETNGIPEWIRLLPLGPVELVDGREPFVVDEEALAAMVAAFKNRGIDLVIDYEHQTVQGDQAPAAGWIKVLEAREDGLWGRVEWTAQARKYLAEREYRYFSPVLLLDPDTRKPKVLLHVALTNVPAIKDLPPLVAKWGAGNDPPPNDPETKRNQGVVPPLPPDLGGLLTALKEQEARSQKFGIGVKEGGRVLKPMEMGEVPEEEWGDPVNYRFACHNQEAARSAWEQWRQPEQQAPYSPQERERITQRLASLLAKQGIIIPPTDWKAYASGEKKERAGMKEVLKARLGLAPETGEELFWQKLEGFWRELTVTLNLSEEASVSQLKGAIEALKAGAGMTTELQEEVQRLKALLADQQAKGAVEEALKQGKISPGQHRWALEYCRRDPEGFRTYVAQVVPVVPVDTQLSLIPDQAGEGELTPAEMAVCKQLNISVSQYREAKKRLSITRHQ